MSSSHLGKDLSTILGSTVPKGSKKSIKNRESDRPTVCARQSEHEGLPGCFDELLAEDLLFDAGCLDPGFPAFALVEDTGGRMSTAHAGGQKTYASQRSVCRLFGIAVSLSESPSTKYISINSV